MTTMKTIRLTMAQALLKFLDNQYVVFDGEETKFIQGVFGVFGHGCVTGLGQALEQGGHSLTYFQGHNEQGMAHAATAFAKQNNRRAIIACVSSIGPGALNMVTAAGTATVNRIPLLLLPGDVFACRQPDPVLQQIEQPSSLSLTCNDAFKPVCRYWDRAERPEQLMTAALNALRVLTDPADTGAVCLALPQDVESEAYDYPESFFVKRLWHIERREPTAGELSRAADMVKRSGKPLLICGGGVRYSEAWEEVRAFCQNCNIPFAETQTGKGLISWDHPLNLGGLGVTGTLAANTLAKEADLIIAVGTRLGDFTTASKWLFPETPVLSINISSFDALKMDSLAVVADARQAILALDGALSGYKSAYSGEIERVRAEWLAEADSLYADERPEGLSQTRAMGIINAYMDKTDIAVGAAGSLPSCMQRLWRPGDPCTYHMEYGFSCMGYEVCGALGAKMAAPDREVYSLLGDGGYLLLHSELYTAVQEGLKINLMVFDNGGWGCIENLQRSQGSPSFGVNFRARDPKSGRLEGPPLPIDFAKNAESYGCKAYTVTTAEGLEAALADAKKQSLPCVFDIKVLPGSMTHGYEAWWRVGVAEVSESEDVRKAYEAMEEEAGRARKY